MKRFAHAGLTLAAIAVLASAGCSATTKQPVTPESTTFGIVASPGKVQLDVAQNQYGVEQLTVKRVVVPSDGFIVVNSDVNGRPGDQLGALFVAKGESLDLAVPLENLTTPKVIVSLYADRGALGTFDYNPLDKQSSADRPFIVSGKEVSTGVAVRQVGIPVGEHQVSIVASAQPGATRSLTVSSVRAPTPAWVVVHVEEDTGQGQRIGLAHVRAGETTGVVVPLETHRLAVRGPRHCAGVRLRSDRSTQ